MDEFITDNNNAAEQIPESAPATEQEAGENNNDGKKAENAPEGKKRQSLVAELYDYFEIFVCSACAVLIIFSFFTRLCRVEGASMEDTLHANEMLIVSKLFYTPECGDIIVFHQTGDFDEPIVKRVIATGGEWVNIEINDQRTKLIVTIYDENMKNPVTLEESYTKYSGSLNTSSIHAYPVQVPEGYLFVLGDNRNHSSDSRSQYIGFVDGRRILGKVICRVIPFDTFGAVS